VNTPATHAADLLTLQQLDALLAAARRALPPEAQRQIANIERNFLGTRSRAAEERERRRTGQENPLRAFPPLDAFLRSPAAQMSPDGSGIAFHTWFDWTLDSHWIIAAGPCDRRWARQADVLQRAASSSRVTETTLYRGESWPANEIPRRFPVGGSFRVPTLTSVTPRRELAHYYAISKTHDVCESTGEVQEPVLLVFQDPRGVTGVGIPDMCAPTPFEERILPRGAVYSVTTVDHTGPIVRIGLAAASRVGGPRDVER
jgi:hypothetical protein